MSAVRSLQFPGREFGPHLELVKIITSAMEDNLFRRFLSRGSAFTTNPDIRKTIRQFGYYCVFFADWCDFDKNLIFVSPSYNIKGKVGPSPMFKLHLVGNRILLPNAFWGEERSWLIENKQDVAIASMVLGWLEGWGIKAKIDSSVAIENIREIDNEARKLRNSEKPPRPKSDDPSYPEYQRQRELYSHRLDDWANLISQAVNDLTCLETVKI